MNDVGALLPKSINLNTVVLLCSVAASFWAQWAIFKERGDNQAAQISQLYGRLDAFDSRVRLDENETATIRAQLDYLMETSRRRGAQNDPPGRQ